MRRVSYRLPKQHLYISTRNTSPIHTPHSSQRPGVLFMDLQNWNQSHLSKNTTSINKVAMQLYSEPLQTLGSYLLGLLAKIKCSICSNQCENWFPYFVWLFFHIHFYRCLGFSWLATDLKPGFRGPSTPPLWSLTKTNQRSIPPFGQYYSQIGRRGVKMKRVDCSRHSCMRNRMRCV